MAPREIRAANLLYGCVLASSVGFLIVGGHLLGLYRLGDPGMLLVPTLAAGCVFYIRLLAWIIKNPVEGRRTAWLSNLAWAGMFGFMLLVPAFQHPGWLTYAVLAFWTLYVAACSPLALRWFLYARKAAWSRAAVQP